ncbi:tyrosine phosphatase family protein [Caulobacter sp. S45]|uniref:tyrosine phosphatase family protein n=1 Tax=Caulobacter sp. S45 TaxID=1641861 RepID=UPI00131C238C|nr:hypothetical protein [Caulobacter sp. S45]
MTLIVCPLDAVADQIVRHSPARLISLLSPTGVEPPVWSGPHLSLRFHDIAEPREGFTPPDAEMVDRLLAFGAAWTEPAPLLVHCWLGISRSTAAAYILACALDPSRSELEVAQVLRGAAPQATPNPLLVRLADARLGREGRMNAAITEIGRGCDADQGAPFMLKARSR